ncbi:hypothetical protein BLA29_006089, partial [Euroglyphus maynei]
PIKLENKVIKPNSNLVIKYKLIGIEVDPIDYTVYYESYKVDNSLKCDPRLKRFFDNSSSSPRLNSSCNVVEQPPDHSQESNFLKSSTIQKLSPQPIKSKPLSSQSTSSSIKISRDPRMRNRITENDLRNSLDTKNSDSNTSIISTSSTDQTITTTTTTSSSTASVAGDLETNIKSQNNSAASDQNTQSNMTEVVNKANDRPSIPSYALSALPITQSLFSSVNGSTLLPFAKPESLMNLNNANDDDDNDDDDDDDDEENRLKVDENPVDSTLNDPNSSSENKLWPKGNKKVLEISNFL